MNIASALFCCQGANKEWVASNVFQRQPILLTDLVSILAF